MKIIYQYRCQTCPAVLRIETRERDAGKSVAITCPRCTHVLPVLLPLTVHRDPPIPVSDDSDDDEGTWVESLIELAQHPFRKK